MAVISQSTRAAQMVAQLRLLKPAISAEVGTPERWIIDTAAQAISESQIDLVGLENALNIDTKFGANLDNFVALFGFARAKATTATGYVVFSRLAPSTTDIIIPAGTRLQSTQRSTDGFIIEFATVTPMTLRAENLKTEPVAIAAVVAGSLGNVPAETINIMVGEIPFGVTEVTNPTATSGGSDQEDDNSLKVRFKNTVFRNLAGTEDQYLALAISTAFSTKANVVGPVSLYKEYVQIPAVNDTETFNFGGGVEKYPGTAKKFVGYGSTSGTTLTLESTTGFTEGESVAIYTGPNVLGETKKVFSGTVKKVLTSTTIELSGSPSEAVEGGVVMIGANRTTAATEWTTALSTIPYAKNIWTTTPVFVTNGQTGLTNYFFKEGTDFNFNFPAKVQGDTLRELIDGVGVQPELTEDKTPQPNVTFTNVYTGGTEGVQAVTPEQVVLFEYSYTSASSRNDLSHNVTNCVDIFVDGQNEQPTTTIFAMPPGISGSAFVEAPNSPYYVENYRRAGEPTKRPIVGNVLTPLMSIPTLGLPEQIQIVDEEGELNNYYRDTHYWLVKDVSELAGTIRARDGIEWSAAVKGDITNLGPPELPISTPPKVTDPSLADPPAYTGTQFALLPSGTPIEVQEYTYDKNVVDLQATYENARQITTDVLAHSARIRYFKLDITIIYDPAVAPSSVNNEIQAVLASYLKSQFFGAAINLSDLLQQIHSVQGVNNVRWTSDVPKAAGAIRIYETDINGLPLLGASIDRIIVGNGSTKEVQRLYVTGKPTKGPIFVAYEGGTAELEDIENETATEIKTALAAASGKTLSVTEDAERTFGVQDSIRSFTITYTANSAQKLPVVSTGYLEGEHVFAEDFFLKDNELPALPTGLQTESTKVLPADTVPGLIIRPRAQGTWLRAN